MTKELYQKIKPLAERGATDGERAAAQAALTRLQAKHGDLFESESDVDLELPYFAKWERYLALSIIEHFGLTAYRVPDKSRRRWAKRISTEAPESVTRLISELYTLHRENKTRSKTQVRQTSIRNWLVSLSPGGFQGQEIKMPTADKSPVVFNSAKIETFRCREWGNGDIPVAELFEWTFLTRREDYENHEQGKNSAMIANTETLKVGTCMTGGLDISTHATDIERACLGKGLALMQQHGYLGAENRRGLGNVHLEFDNAPDGTAYDDYLSANRVKILEYLEEIGAIEKQADMFGGAA